MRSAPPEYRLDQGPIRARSRHGRADLEQGRCEVLSAVRPRPLRFASAFFPAGVIMGRYLAALLTLAVALAAAPAAFAQEKWVEGRHYFLVTPQQRTSVPAGKVEVMEVFSYGCPACNQFNAVAKKLKSTLPANAQFVYLPAAFNPAEDWPMFQRAYFAALALGVAEKAHDAMFDSIWRGGELSIQDAATRRLKNPLPSIEDAAKFYARVTGVKAADFLAAAKSFGTEVKIKNADAYILAAHVDSTPTIIVNGKYRLTPTSAGSYDQTIELTNYLVAKESRGAAAATAPTTQNSGAAARPEAKAAASGGAAKQTASAAAKPSGSATPK
jgi:protein dithiol oxidoreductase (disulfide-forming)